MALSTVFRQIEGAVTAPRGFRAGTAACGIKAFTAGASAIPSDQRDDLMVLASDTTCACACSR